MEKIFPMWLFLESHGRPWKHTIDSPLNWSTDPEERKDPKKTADWNDLWADRVKGTGNRQIGTLNREITTSSSWNGYFVFNSSYSQNINRKPFSKEKEMQENRENHALIWKSSSFFEDKLLLNIKNLALSSNMQIYNWPIEILSLS